MQSLMQTQSSSLYAETDARMTMDENNEDTNVPDTNMSVNQAAFVDAIEEIVAKRNVIRDFRKNDEDLEIVKQSLIGMVSLVSTLPPCSVSDFLPPSNGVKGYTKQKLQDRRELYLNKTNLTMDQHKLGTVLLAHLADHCAKTSNPKPLYAAWDNILSAGMIPLSRTLSTYLYVLGLDEDVCSEERDVAAEVAMLHDAIYEPTEKTISLLVKSFVARGDAAGAEALLDGIADGPLSELLRHRTTSPILKLHCENGDIGSALRLYHRMRTTSRVKMDDLTYSNFIAAVAQNGYFLPDSNEVEGGKDLGYDAVSGPQLLDVLITEMAQDVLDISEESAIVLQHGFALGFQGFECAANSLDPITSLCGNDVLVANRVPVDHNTGKCPATDATLQLIVLEPEQRVHVHDTLLEMAREKSMGYTAKLAAKGRVTHDHVEKAELATKILKDFSDWLDSREGRPYTAIVDGANVAYFGWGKVNVHQLNLMVEALKKKGEDPLVVFPQKYTRRKFHLRQGMMQILQDEELEILERLQENDQMYVVPPMCLDDMYWMLASVSMQTKSTNGLSIDVAKNNEEGRFPGLRPIVISNDKMRDHKDDLLDERAFRRWACSHIVNYNFTEYIEGQQDEREISFHAADIFSDEIQRNECPGGGMAWHFPVSEWDANERFCLRLPSANGN
jgi:pentatricopeptide repeat protein